MRYHGNFQRASLKQPVQRRTDVQSTPAISVIIILYWIIYNLNIF